MIAFIDAHRDQFGVELICRILRAAIPGFLTARGYRAARTRPASDREIRDEQLIADLRTLHQDNFSVYGPCPRILDTVGDYAAVGSVAARRA
ncbi:transposase, partial [Mycolicibacterium phlei]|nr:transposase [Mycolicibacterium phlei]